MLKKIQKILTRITSFIQEVIDDELRIMDRFYGQYA